MVNKEDLVKKIKNLQGMVKEFIKSSEPSLVRNVFNRMGKRVKLSNYFNAETLSVYRLNNANNSVTSNMSSVSNRISKSIVKSTKKKSASKSIKKKSASKKKKTKKN